MLYVIVRICLYRERHALQFMLIAAITQHTDEEDKLEGKVVVVKLPWRKPREEAQKLHNVSMHSVLKKMGSLKEMLLPQPTPTLGDYFLAFCMIPLHILGPCIARWCLLPDSQVAYLPRERNIACSMVLSSGFFGLVVADFWM